MKVTPKTRYLSLNNLEELSLVVNTVHYMHYAMAAYGWPIYIFQNKTVPVCKAVFMLTTSMACCCLPCCTAKKDEGAVLLSDNCCSCNMAALKQVLAQKNCDLVYATFHVDVGETPFFIGVDYEKKAVVISIRGTLSMQVKMVTDCYRYYPSFMQDIMTDLQAESEVLPVRGQEWKGHKVRLTNL